MKKIIVSSLNKTKIHAVKAVFSQHKIIPIHVPSNVKDQPMSDLETKEGAMNRAFNAKELYPLHIAIGLEGGVMFMEDELYLCNWGALVTMDGKLMTAAGARIRLPDSFIAPLHNGEELSTLMNEYTKKTDIRSQEGAIGIFTANAISRTDLFVHVVTLLKGQMVYSERRS